MTKPRLLAFLIVALAMVMFILVADDLWQWLAYEDDTSGTISTSLVFGTAHPLTAAGDFDRVEHKRMAWFPGPDWILSYTCGQCMGELHDRCQTGNEVPIAQTNIRNHPRTDILRFRCICPDPGH